MCRGQLLAQHNLVLHRGRILQVKISHLSVHFLYTVQFLYSDAIFFFGCYAARIAALNPFELSPPTIPFATISG